MPRYREVRVRYDVDPNNFQVAIRFRIYDETTGPFPTPVPPLIVARILSTTDPIAQASRIRKNIIRNYRRVITCFEDSNTKKEVQRTVIVPYAPYSGQLLDCIREILSTTNVVNGKYEGETQNIVGAQRWL